MIRSGPANAVVDRRLVPVGPHRLPLADTCGTDGRLVRLTLVAGRPYDAGGEGIGTTTDNGSLQRVEVLCAALVAKKATDVTVIDIAELSSVADHFVVASSRSRTAVQALADAVLLAMGESGVRPLRTEGYADARWICIDFGDVVVHLFQDDVRRYFDLERLWGDAPQRPVSDEAALPL